MRSLRGGAALTINDAQKARGHIARSESDVESERAATRDEWETRMAEIARIQEEADQLRARSQS